MPTFVGTFIGGSDETRASDYARALRLLLPPGRLWDLEPDSELTAMLVAMADEFERVAVRGANLIEETDPRTASETLPDWEKMLGLPDAQVLVIPSTIEERRVVVTAKYTARGGQNYQFFSDLCANAGWPLVSIAKGPALLLRVGFRVGARVYGANWAYSMNLTLNTPTAGAMAKADFERLVRHVTHAHISVLFTYL